MFPISDKQKKQTFLILLLVAMASDLLAMASSSFLLLVGGVESLTVPSIEVLQGVQGCQTAAGATGLWGRISYVNWL